MYQNRGNRGRARGFYQNYNTRRPAGNSPNFANLKLDACTSTLGQDKFEAVNRLQNSLNKYESDTFSVEAQYSSGHLKNANNLLWVPTTWDQKALFGCFWVGSSKRRSLEDAEIALNLFMAASYIAIRCGYTGIMQLASSRYQCWINSFIDLFVGGSYVNILMGMFCDSVQYLSFSDFMLSACEKKKEFIATRKTTFDVIIKNFAEPGRYFDDHLKHVVPKNNIKFQTIDPTIVDSFGFSLAIIPNKVTGTKKEKDTTEDAIEDKSFQQFIQLVTRSLQTQKRGAYRKTGPKKRYDFKLGIEENETDAQV